MTFTNVVFPEFWRPTRVSSISSFQKRLFIHSQMPLKNANISDSTDVTQNGRLAVTRLADVKATPTLTIAIYGKVITPSSSLELLARSENLKPILHWFKKLMIIRIVANTNYFHIQMHLHTHQMIWFGSYSYENSCSPWQEATATCTGCPFSEQPMCT